MGKILVIYDYASVRELLAEELAADGHLVVPVSKVALAREVIETLRPDLVLLSLHINGEDKWEILEELKRVGPNIPFLVLRTCPGHPQSPAAPQHDLYVIQSSKFDGLRHKVAEILNRKLDRGGKLTKKNDYRFQGCSACKPRERKARLTGRTPRKRRNAHEKNQDFTPFSRHWMGNS